ncbi:MAG: hypothetical protein E6K07_06025 [Methanobacteriota archaeon]|nr:MAG: hypothetical protein E6K07_06025 [Euryarchaeota archaeon]TLZ91092.1 MAG: hypothetical protein E6K01_01670 [Euryarchaeota archaeon]
MPSGRSAQARPRSSSCPSSSRSSSGRSEVCSRRRREPRKGMTAKSPDPPVSNLIDRLFLYGIRSVLVVLAVVAFGIFLIVHGWIVSRFDYLASGVLIVMIGVGLAFAFQQTTTKVITQRYFSGDTLVGKTGRALVAMKSTGKGVVHVEHESWSAVAEEDIARGEPIIVTAVESDNVTLKVRKHQT